MFEEVIASIRKIHGRDDFIPLHEPIFQGNEREYVLETIDSTFVSSVGKFVDRFEDMMADYTGSKYSVACVNGTSALHVALIGAGVQANDEVITQPLTFVATTNAIAYCNASPVFVDIDEDTLGLSASKLKEFFENDCEKKGVDLVNRHSGRRIAAVVPMHTFGFACRIEEISQICLEYNIPLVEDSAESIGTRVGGKHTGTFGKLGIFSFNGNKTITSGGGGAVVTNDEKLAKHIKHLTTTAKVPHRWEYRHDAIGFNYRMPNINAKRLLAEKYRDLFEGSKLKLFWERPGTKANFWLNTLIMPNKEERDIFLAESNDLGVMTRPAWELVRELNIFENTNPHKSSCSNEIVKQIVNIPSSPYITV